MPVIGTFKAVKDGYAGTIRTLTLNAKVRIVANDRKESDDAPDFRIFAGATEIGAAWRKTSRAPARAICASSSMIPPCRSRSGARCSKRPTTASCASSGAGRSRATPKEIEQSFDRQKSLLTEGLSVSHENLAPRRLAAVVLLPFGLAYFLSYGLRNINALIAGTLMTELDIGASQLGLLTGVLFLAMAVVQLPLGVALDRYGPRRVQSVLLLFVVVGAVITSMASSIAGLLTGRILIGIGTSTCLMAGLKAIVMTAPPHASRAPTAF